MTLTRANRSVPAPLFVFPGAVVVHMELCRSPLFPLYLPSKICAEILNSAAVYTTFPSLPFLPKTRPLSCLLSGLSIYNWVTYSNEPCYRWPPR